MLPQDPAAALTELRELFDLQRNAFAREPSPSAGERRGHLDALCRLLRDNAGEIAAAIDADFGHRSLYETRLLEIFPSLEAARHAKARVGRWMRPERRRASVWFWPARVEVVKQPLGVMGIIAPWNYPLYLAAGPLASALAAGNRVILKPSEFTPRFGALLRDLVGRYFARERVAVALGGVELARAFAQVPFDHILFSGSTAVGREVMRAAAENLTPVTLELGGKSPAIVARGFPLKVAAEKIILGKCLNAGQTCIAPDYALLPQGTEEAFVEEARRAVGRFYPEGAASADYSAIINSRHHERLTSLVEDARQKGARVIELSAGGSGPGRRMPPTIITGVDDGMRIMQEEIFGPVLPVRTYRELGEALGYVGARPRPLALYYFDYDREGIDRVLAESISGGVTVNDTLFHIAQNELPFGGVGPSGMGHYHGQDGFNTFTKRKGVLLQSRLAGTRLLQPPYGKLAERLLRLMLR